MKKFLSRDYFGRPDSSLSCSFSPQGLFRPAGFIPILLFFSSGIISTNQIHLYLTLFLLRDYFAPDRCISILLFFSTGIISASQIHLYLAFFSTGIIATARIHLYLALFLHRDYFSQPDSSLSCSFSPQGLFRLGQMHLYLALLLYRDYFNRPDSSLSGFSVPQGLFQPPGFIPIWLFCSAGIISPRSDTSPIAENISARPFRQFKFV